MPYPSPLPVHFRSLAPDLATLSAPFSIGVLNAGARMAVVKLPLLLVVWLTIPFLDTVKKELTAFAGEGYLVSHIVVPNKGHTICAKEYKEAFPDAVVVGPAGVKNVEVGFEKEAGGKVLTGPALVEAVPGLSAEFAEAFDAVYIPECVAAEVVLRHKNTKVLLAADLLFNIAAGASEQYGGASMVLGLSFVGRFMNDQLYAGRFYMRKLVPNTPGVVTGLKAVLGMDWDTMVMCHGNVVEGGAKDRLAAVFLPYWA